MTVASSETMSYALELGEWQHTRREPHPALRPCVRQYEDYAETRVEFTRRMEVPSTDVVLIINLGPAYRVSGPGNLEGATEYQSFAAGLIDTYVIVESTGLSRATQVNFSPIGAHLVFGMPMHELTNRAVHLDQVLGAAGNRLVAQLEDTPDATTRFDVLDAFIARRIAQGPTPSPVVAFALDRLQAASGSVSIRALTDDVGWSRKHLAERFREQVGLSPKTMARVLRFSGVVKLLGEAAPERWSDVAYDCGYYDQAHFNHEFRAFTGGTPSEFMARRIADGGLRFD